MCGRFSLDTNRAAIVKEFDCTEVAGNIPRYNIAPSQQVTVIVERDNVREGLLMKWGLIPHWVKDLTKWDLNLFNARSESVKQKPSFKAAFRKYPCLIPASGFYEWHRDRDSSTQQPYNFYTENRILAMAGIYDIWQDLETDKELMSCSILTTEAQGEIASIHSRMPIIVPPEHYQTWLSGFEDRINYLENLPNVLLKLYPVSTIVNSAKNDVPKCVVPIN